MVVCENFSSLQGSLSRGELIAVSEYNIYLVELVAKMRGGLEFDASLRSLRLKPAWEKIIRTSIRGVDEFKRLAEQRGA